jgi:hypothetical protein
LWIIFPDFFNTVKGTENNHVSDDAFGLIKGISTFFSQTYPQNMMSCFKPWDGATGFFGGSFGVAPWQDGKTGLH